MTHKILCTIISFVEIVSLLLLFCRIDFARSLFFFSLSLLPEFHWLSRRRASTFGCSLMLKYLTSCNFIFTISVYFLMKSFHRSRDLILMRRRLLPFQLLQLHCPKCLGIFHTMSTNPTQWFSKISLKQFTIYGYARQDFYYLAVIQFPSVSAA